MGSQTTKEEYAYIAGFLDGDGSLMFQIKKRNDTSRKWRFMTTICLYQDTRHEDPLYWIKVKLGIGYISHRNDGITELRINGFKQTQKILNELLPYLRFKKIQAKAICRACKILSEKSMSMLCKKDKKILCKCIMDVQGNNYATHGKKSLEEVYSIVGLTP